MRLRKQRKMEQDANLMKVEKISRESNKLKLDNAALRAEN
jgi:hypothetical protein